MRMQFQAADYLGMRVYKAVCKAGDVAQFKADRPMARGRLTTTQYWAGDFRYEKPDGSVLADISRGMVGPDLPDFPEAGTYTLRAMADGAFYYCISRLDKGPLVKQKFDLRNNQPLPVPVGRVVFVDDGASVKIIVTKTKSTTITGPARGLVVWAP